MPHTSDATSQTSPALQHSLGPTLDQLFDLIQQRRTAEPDSSYTARLFHKGTKKIAQKVGEEGVETALAAVTHDLEEVVKESADLIFHLLVLWADSGVTPAEVIDELNRREGISGLAEKAARPKS